VALYALHDESAAAGVRGVVCLSTPFLQLQPREFGDYGPFSVLLMLAGALFLICLGVNAALFPSDRHENVSVALFWVSLIGSLLVGNKLTDAWISFAKRRFEEYAAPELNVPMLIIRATGDEASSILGGSYFVAWCVNKIFGWLASLAGLAAWLLFLLVAGIFKHGPIVVKVAAVGLGLFLAPFVLIGFGAIGVLALLLTVVAGFLLLPFGVDFGLISLLVEVSAEPTPPGLWPVHNFRPEREWVGDVATPSETPSLPKPSSWLVHSYPYDDPRVHELLARWTQNATVKRPVPPG